MIPWQNCHILSSPSDCGVGWSGSEIRFRWTLGLRVVVCDFVDEGFWLEIVYLTRRKVIVTKV